MNNEQLTNEIMAVKEQISALARDVKTAFVCINDQKKLIDTVHELGLSIRDLTHESKHMRTDMDKMKLDINEIQLKPARRWETVMLTTLTTLVSTAVGGLIGWMVTKGL